MPTVYESLDAAIREVTAARARVIKIKTMQVRGVDDIAALKATAQTWFHTHRPIVAAGAAGIDLTSVDQYYNSVLGSTAKHAARQTYLTALKNTKSALIAARAATAVTPVTVTGHSTDDLAPDFAPLAGNQQMRDILTRRWHECCKCVSIGAHLAGIVMMGGLLEALFVARANKLTDKKPLIRASRAPKDKTTGTTLNYQDWTLDAYIAVAHELGWISDSGKNVSDVLKEYRNYVHPEKELRHGIVLSLNDSSLFWQVTKALARQLLLSAARP